MTRLLLLVGIIQAATVCQNHMVMVPCCQFIDSVSGTSITTVSAGTTVQWNLQGFLGHTVTNGTGAADPAAGTLFDGSLNLATTTFAFTFNTPGVFPYFCRPHELLGMNGTVIVTAPASVTSTGSGCGGAGFGASGLPQLGNANFALTVTGGPPNGSALLFLADGVNPGGLLIPGTSNCLLWLEPISFSVFLSLGLSPIGPLPLDAGGNLTFPLPVPNDNGLMGVLAHGQFGLLAPGGSLTTTNALSLVFGI